MRVRIKFKLLKGLSLILSLVLVFSVLPMSTSFNVFAADEVISIQYLINNVVQPNVEISIKDIDTKETIDQGTTNSIGVWQSSVLYDELPTAFNVSIAENSSSIEKSDEYKKYLIIDQSEKSWSDTPSSLSELTVSAENESLLRGDDLSLAASVTGTADSYQWYFESVKIDGATESTYQRSEVKLSDSGTYSCKASDSFNGTSKTSTITISVINSAVSGASLVAYYGDDIIADSIQRGAHDQIKLMIQSLPTDALISSIEYYANDSLLKSTTETYYSFDVEDSVSDYSCHAIVTFASKYEQLKLELSSFSVEDLKSQESIIVSMPDNVSSTYNESNKKYEPSYSPDNFSFDVTVSGGSGNGKYCLELTDVLKADGTTPLSADNFVTISNKSDKWTVTIKQVCSFNLKAFREASGIYGESGVKALFFSVSKAEVQNFNFNVPKPASITYNDNNNTFINVVEGFEGVTYSIISENSCCTIDEISGKLTILKAGSVTVKAYLAGTENYNAASAEYTLIVDKDDQSIAFEEKTGSIYYGQSYVRKASPIINSEAGDGYGYNVDGEIHYSIDSDTDVASVASDGTLTLNQSINSVTVKAIIDGNECYNEAQTTYTLTIENYFVDDDSYTISGNKSDKSDWYNSNINITPNESYLISTSNSLNDNDWKTSLLIDTEGKDNGLKIYLKQIVEGDSAFGAISNAIDISSEKLKLDKSIPENLSVDYKTSAWYETLLESVTFGYYNSVVTFVLKASDSYSGVDHFIWRFNSEAADGNSISDTEVTANDKNGVFESGLCEIGNEGDLKEFRGKLSFEAYDKAGNFADHDEDYVIVIDNTDPTLSISTNITAKETVNNSYPFETANDYSSNPIKVFDDSVTITFSVIERNFFADNVIITINDVAVSNINWQTFGDNHIAEYELNQDGDYQISFTYTDVFGKDINHIEDKNVYEETENICIDKESPEISVIMSNQVYEDNGIKYYNNSVTAKVSVKELKFRPSNIVVSASEGMMGIGTDNIMSLTESNNWTFDKATSTYFTTVVIDSAKADGKYQFLIDYTDISGHKAVQYVSDIFIIDTVAPVIMASYGEANILDSKNNIISSFDDGNTMNVTVYSKEKIKVVFSVEEINFCEENMKAILKNGDVSNEVNFDGEWVTNGSTHTNSVTITEKGTYKLTVSGSDYSQNSANDYTTPKLIIDDTVPAITFEYLPASSRQYYSEEAVKVTINVFDDYFAAKNRVSYELKVQDIYGNAIDFSNEDSLPDFEDESNWTSESEGCHSITLMLSTEGRYSIDINYKDASQKVNTAKDDWVIDRTAPTHQIEYVTPMFQTIINTVTFAQVYRESANVKVTVKDDIAGVEKVDISYPNELTPVEDYYSQNFITTYTKAADKNSTDSADLVAEWEINAEKAKAQAKANINVFAYDNAGNCTDEQNAVDTENVTEIDNVAPVIYSDITTDGSIENHGFMITIKEAHFEADRFSFSPVQMVDIGGNAITLSDSFYKYFQEDDNWKCTDGFTHTIVINTTDEASLEDGIYIFEVTGADTLGNKANKYTTPMFYVDKSAPTELGISYSTPKNSVKIGGATYNYYNDNVKATFIAQDSTTGIDRFNWSFLREKNASSINVSSLNGVLYGDSESETSENGSMTRYGEATKSLYGKSSEQYRGSFSFSAVDRADNESEEYNDNTVIVVDTIAPTRTVEYSESKNTVGDFEQGGKAYFDGTATVTIKITEANFYPEDVNLTINDELYKDIEWDQTGDVWTGIIAFSDDGHYFISMNYSDRSTNQMEEYVSGEIIVDTIVPVINVSYSPDKPVFTEESRAYYNENQVATITITEHNFDVSNVNASLSAKSIDGKELNVTEIIAGLSNESSWKTNGDVHTAIVTYSDDANYTFDIECTDLALHISEDYPADEITVDKTAPVDLSVKYSKSVLDTIIESVTFGFYDSPVNVKVSAKDEISGVESFTYIYSNTDTKESKTNVLTAKTNGSSGTATFTLPADNSQFIGNLRVSVMDKSGNKSAEYIEKHTIVVDSIAPVGSIEFSAPVSTVDGVAYYSGDVIAKVIIDEANFYGDDVLLYVDGSATAPSSWTYESNCWVSHIVISSDGQHIVSMNYTDKSGNVMNNYKSSQFVIDHTSPNIMVSGIKNSSANKDEKIGFTIKAEDANFSSGGFEPKLVAVVQSKSGEFKTKTIDIGTARSSQNGYIISVDNLTDDGIYSLTCKATDRCGNISNSMYLQGSGAGQLTKINFSVNRNGSAYSIDDNTKALIEKYYTKSVNNDIVVTEVNVDPLSNYSVKLNNAELKENQDFSVKKSGGNGTWYKYVYTINADLFTKEDEYSVVLNSIDETNNIAYSDIKSAEIMFVVDDTAPIISTSGIESNGRYQSDKQTVNIVPTDDGGRIYSLRIEVYDSDGNITNIPYNISGNKLESLLESSKGILSFSVDQGVRQKIRIVCADKAGNTYDSEESFDNITVSSNKAVILWASTQFRIILIAAIMVCAALIIIIIIKHRKRKASSSKA